MGAVRFSPGRTRLISSQPAISVPKKHLLRHLKADVGLGKVHRRPPAFPQKRRQGHRRPLDELVVHPQEVPESRGDLLQLTAKGERDRPGLDFPGGPVGQGTKGGDIKYPPARTDSIITAEFSGERPTT